MNCHELDPLLDDYLDDRLTESARVAVERHLADCPACRRGADGLRAVAEAAASLPREIPPPRDLFPGVRESIERDAYSSSSFFRGGALPSWSRWAGVAASLLLACGVLAVGWLRDGREPIAAGPPAAGPAYPAAHSTLVELDFAESQYLEATEMLLSALNAQSGEIPAESREVIEQNLRIIDRAIEDVRSALQAQPDDGARGRSLAALHQRKIDLLLRASRLSS